MSGKQKKMADKTEAVEKVAVEKDGVAGTEQAVAQKRVLWVTGDKGGTGKSTLARGLAHTLLRSGLEVALFDGDPTNAQLFRYYKDAEDGVTRVNLKERTGADEILVAMEEGDVPIILVDVPGGGSQILPRLEDEVGFLSAMEETGYLLTVVSAMSRIKDSVNQLKFMMETTEGYHAAHVAVKNLYYGEGNKFRFFDRSKTKQRLLDEGGVVLEMRDLYEDTYERLDDHDLSFQRAIACESELPKPDVRRVNQWLKHLKGQVVSANGLLGL